VTENKCMLKHEMGATDTLAAFNTIGTSICPFTGTDPQSSLVLGKGV